MTDERDGEVTRLMDLIEGGGTWRNDWSGWGTESAPLTLEMLQPAIEREDPPTPLLLHPSNWRFHVEWCRNHGLDPSTMRPIAMRHYDGYRLT